MLVFWLSCTAVAAATPVTYCLFVYIPMLYLRVAYTGWDSESPLRTRYKYATSNYFGSSIYEQNDREPMSESGEAEESLFFGGWSILARNLIINSCSTKVLPVKKVMLMFTGHRLLSLIPWPLAHASHATDGFRSRLRSEHDRPRKRRG